MLTLKDLSTRELLKSRRIVHDYEWDPSVPDVVGKRMVAGGAIETVSATLDEVLAELNTRNHVAGKREAKVLRRLKAQTGQTEEWLRLHPKYGQELVDAQYPNRRICTKQWAEKMAPHYGQWFGRMFKVQE